MSNTYIDKAKSSLIINKLTRAQYESSSKDEDQLWILTDVVDFQADLTENIYAPSAKYEGQITQHIGVTTSKYIQGYFYKCISDGQEPATYTWEQIDSQPAQALSWGNISGNIENQTDLNNALNDKVVKTTDLNKIYGTDNTGAQTTYDKSNFGKVDDVKIDGTSVVNSSNIANIVLTGKVDHYSILPVASADYVGKPVQYMGNTTLEYKHGYFYEVVDTEIPNVTVDEVTGEITVSVDANTFAASGYTYGTISFSFNGTNWVANGSSVDTSALGITIVGEPQTGDSFDIIFSEPSHTYHWDSLKIDYNDLINKPSIYGSTYIHDQAEASDEWVIQHNMGKYPSVTIVDSANTTILGTWTYDSSNQVTVHLSSASTGKAFLN